METELSFGERVRRLRKAKGWSLHDLAGATELSYSHLSRVENDSVPPGVETVTKLVDVLDADLAEMLELANCLPRQILDRIVSRNENTAESLRRAAGPSQHRADSAPSVVASLARQRGLPEEQAEQVAQIVERLLDLPTSQREAVIALILSMARNNET